LKGEKNMEAIGIMGFIFGLGALIGFSIALLFFK